MCLIVFAYKVDQTPFLLAGNRDEFYSRPTKEAQFWETKPDILAGKDLKAGGTWMGITKKGRFAALTNYRDMNQIKENAPSRGHIVSDFLESDIDTESYLESLGKKGHQYNGFNLIAGYVDNLYYYTNQKDGFIKLKPGYYSISNAFLQTEWPKTKDALQEFKQLLKQGAEDEKFFDMLANPKTYPLDELPATGLSDELEKAVSAIFIQTEDYGSRCSTVIETKNDSEISFSERTYIKGTNKEKKTVNYEFEIDS